MSEPKPPWPHAPTHPLSGRGTYFLTASTRQKTHHYCGAQRLDQTPGRQVWFNFRETRLTHQRSYLTQLNYVHQNAVKHGLVPVASQYPWCSAAWFERTASTAMVKSIYRFKTNRILVPDEFEVSLDW